ncbi:Peroxisomal membrane protein LPX1 [Psilocybe cubensis]|uniref:Peroxisomal membrane protein LPX1 n=2 Tax=Psilocybe cubensis TaxID=181762 RepID=A0ACB8HFT9_PSICU|nr:Peroxisomal membrane protein LPX1 [Psilocybe cubensis]KAH9486020.1 Peroxisomal membrane protein LPX1 [Psilocybe cubensis]
MNIDTFAFEAPSNLKIAAKRYSYSNDQGRRSGLTLLFMHCVGSHKEQWEPIIDRLFHIERTEGVYFLREAWAFDWQSHGDSAVLNREALKSMHGVISAYEWTTAVAWFVKSPLMNGHRIVPVGHSAGAAVSIHLTNSISPERFASIVLVEPTISTKPVFDSHREDRMARIDFAVAATKTRRDHWRSREQAFDYFRKRIPWDTWDERVVRLMAKHALEDSPDGGVRLKWDKQHEAVSYLDMDPHFVGAIQLAKVCHSVPIHVIWGTQGDLVPEFIQESLSDASEGRVVASVTKIEDAGHMVVQEQPDLVANALANILRPLAKFPRAKL